MQEIIAENISYHRIECHTAEAVRVFSERGMNDKVRLLETSGSLYTYYYTLGDTVDYYYGNLLPSTGYIKLFKSGPWSRPACPLQWKWYLLLSH